MMRSTDTWHGRPCAIAVRGGRGEHAFRAAGVDHHRRSAGRAASRAIERRDHASAFARAAVFGRQHELDAEIAEEIEIEQLVRALRAP